MPIKRHGVVLLGLSAGGHPLLLGPRTGGDPPSIGAKCRRRTTFYWGLAASPIKL